LDVKLCKAKHCIFGEEKIICSFMQKEGGGDSCKKGDRVWDRCGKHLKSKAIECD
jgi:hypothetical protein